jgi:aldose 1-epimerase
MPAAEQIFIRSSANECRLCPTIGGSISGWKVSGQDMFRPTDMAGLASGDPLQMASFPLVPYSNRIAHARFLWNGRTFALTRNAAPEAHAIHGTGWRAIWTVAEQGDSHCRLILYHKADTHWPWDFEASQHFEVGDNYLKMDLKVTNASDQPAPLAFGHHPYFDAEGAMLTFNAENVLMGGIDGLPSETERPSGQLDFSHRSAITGRDIDHCYAGWDGRARLEWTGRRLALDIEAEMTAVVVYIPKDGTEFCFEPVPHVSNALNRAGLLPSMPVIDPDDNYSAKITYRAVP